MICSGRNPMDSSVRPSRSLNSTSNAVPSATSSTIVPTCQHQRLYSGKSTVKATTSSNLAVFFVTCITSILQRSQEQTLIFHTMVT
jgi:hypothetical protein